MGPAVQAMLRDIRNHVIDILADALDVDLVLLHRDDIHIEGKNRYNHKGVEDQGQGRTKKRGHDMRISIVR